MRETNSVEEVGTQFGNASWELFCLDNNISENGEFLGDTEGLNENNENNNHYNFDYDSGNDYLNRVTLPIVIEEEIPQEKNNSNQNDEASNEENDLRIRRSIKFTNFTSFDCRKFLEENSRNQSLTFLDKIRRILQIENQAIQRLSFLSNRYNIPIGIQKGRLYY